MPRILLSVLLLVMLAPVAVADDPPLLEPDVMRERLARVHDLILEVHPDPLHARDAASFEAFYGELEDRLSRPLAPEAFARIAAELAAYVRDAHTSVSFQGRDVWLPLRFAWASDGLGIVAADEAHADLVGAKVLGLQPLTLAGLEARLHEIVPAENHHWALRHGSSRLSRGSFLAAVLQSDVPEFVKLAVEVGGRRRVVKIALERHPLPPDPTARSAAYEWTVLPEVGAAWLALRSCPRPDRKYERAIADLFHEIAARDLQTLVIDVRGNGGGNSAVLDAIARHLPPDELLDYSGVRRLSAPAIEQRGLDVSHFDVRPGTDLADLPKEPWVKPRDATRLTPFTGDVYVLTDAGTFSSANWIAVMFRDNGLGRIVGAPTGNAPSSFGDILSFDLEDGARLTISFTQWVRPDPSRDPAETLKPDVEVPTTLADLVSGRDPVAAWLVTELGGDPSKVAGPVWPEQLRPTVVEVSPSAGSEAVDPATSLLRVTFSEPMSANSWSLVGTGHGRFPPTPADARWESDTVMVIPVALAPGERYALGINSLQYDGFRSRDGVGAEPFLWVFTTAER